MVDWSSFLNKIQAALENSVTLEIITAVGQIKGGPEKNAEIDWTKNPTVMLTKINLLQGDIETVFDPAYVTGDYQALRDFHADREKEGYDIVQKNLQALKELFNLAKLWSGEAE
jgi:hypothetical protein